MDGKDTGTGSSLGSRSRSNGKGAQSAPYYSPSQLLSPAGGLRVQL